MARDTREVDHISSAPIFVTFAIKTAPIFLKIEPDESHDYYYECS